MKKTVLIINLLFIIILMSSCSDKPIIELIYSASSSERTTETLPVSWIKTYDAYVNLGFDYGLDETFFDDNQLYVYTFMNNNLGTDIYSFKDYQVIDDKLLLDCYETPDKLVMTAFGTYTMVFSIPKTLVSNTLEVYVFFDDEIDMVFDQTVEISGRPKSIKLMFDIEETRIFNINFTDEVYNVATVIKGSLINLDTKQTIVLNGYSGLFGYNAELESGAYMFILDYSKNDDLEMVDYDFNYYAYLDLVPPSSNT